MEKSFTAADLQRFNGKNGQPAYIACNGTVYDVTALFNWDSGSHMSMHDAGCDLTEELLEAPHGSEVLDRATAVGRLLAD